MSNIGHFWCGGIKNENLNFLRECINAYLLDLEAFWGIEEYTPNSHQINHLVDSFINTGPLCFNNLFVFENKNRLIKQLVQSSFSINQQICEANELNFFLNL